LEETLDEVRADMPMGMFCILDTGRGNFDVEEGEKNEEKNSP